MLVCTPFLRLLDYGTFFGMRGLRLSVLVLQFLSTMPKAQVDRSFLEAALIGFEHSLEQVNSKIAEIRGMLGGTDGVGSPSGQRNRRGMSAAGRAKIAAAQRKRWAAVKRQTPKAAAPKMSAAARKRIGDATRKRWADYRAKMAAKSS